MESVTNFAVLMVTMAACLHHCVTAAVVMDAAALSVAMDANSDGTVTSREVMALFASWGDNPSDSKMIRCEFTDVMTSQFHGSSDVSVLFDVMQQQDGDTLSAGELRTAALGSRDSLSTPQVQVRLIELSNKAETSGFESYKETTGTNPMLHTDYDVTSWASEVDADHDDVISGGEMGLAAHRWDLDGDFRIPQCEFVDYMRKSFSQHPIAAHRMYDVIFHNRDSTWARVDTDFLLQTMDTDQNALVTISEFIKYFTLLNQEASGASVPRWAREPIITKGSNSGGAGTILDLGVVAMVTGACVSMLHFMRLCYFF